MCEIPLKTGSNGRELSKQCLIFVRGMSEHCQLIPQIDGSDWNFLFGNARRFTPFPSCLGTIQVSEGSALMHTNYCITYLGFEITLG